ncbi:MAG: hypothetical protein M0Z47_02640 [Actinomycetota bacterium]|nr:hypothetical protein [Actinomycetota bacterium]
MSTLWTPEGEYEPQRGDEATTGAQEEQGEPTGEQLREAQRIADELRSADPAAVVANHCYGLFELAAVHLSSQPPNLSAASMAIDALAGIIDQVGERLWEYRPELSDGLGQLRLAFIQLSSIGPQNGGAA